MNTQETIIYKPEQLYKIIDDLNYKKHPEKRFVFTRANEIIDENFHKCLKIIEGYYHKNNKQYEQKKLNFGNKNLRRRQNNFIRQPIKERPITFLNKDNGLEAKIKKEINGDLNKLSPSNSEKIFSNIIKKYEENIEIFDYNYFIENLFDKAVMQPTYCPLYVKLFILINDKSKEDSKFADLVKYKCEDFKSLIVDMIDMNDAVLNPNDYDDFCQKNKEKIFKNGFSQFIGELFKNDFVDCIYIQEYIEALVINIKHNLENDNKNIENSSICLVKLIQTTMNKKEFKDSSSFDYVNEILEYKNLPKKIKFKFLDLIEK